MKKLFLAVMLFSLSVCAFAQQDYVGRYDVYGGYSYLGSPKINLSQRGFNFQAGVNLTRWLVFGVDYSNQDGRGTLVPNELKTAYYTDVEGLIGCGNAAYGLEAPVSVGGKGLSQGDAYTAFSTATPSDTYYGCPPAVAYAPIAPGYDAYVPFSARTQTFAAGPQFVYRHFKKISLFIHPSIGAIHEHIQLEPHDAFTDFVAGPAGALVAAGVLQNNHPSDTTYFYGFGGGGDFNATKHVHLRADVEFVHVDLFSGLLADARNSVRLSIGPTFNFGKNVKR